MKVTKVTDCSGGFEKKGKTCITTVKTESVVAVPALMLHKVL